MCNRFIGAIIRKESFVKSYSYFLYIHLIINVAVGSYFLWIITHTATLGEGSLCTEIFQNDGVQSTCNKLFSMGKDIFIGIIVCIWLIELCTWSCHNYLCSLANLIVLRRCSHCYSLLSHDSCRQAKCAPESRKFRYDQAQSLRKCQLRCHRRPSQ